MIAAAGIVITIVKAGIVALLFRATCPNPDDAMRAGSVLTAAGEFAYVLIPFGVTLSVMGMREASLFSAIAAATMLMGPPVAALADKALAHAATVMTGFTHLQTAQPVTFGHHLLAYVEMFARDRGRFAEAQALFERAIALDPNFVSA